MTWGWRVHRNWMGARHVEASLQASFDGSSYLFGHSIKKRCLIRRTLDRCRESTLLSSHASVCNGESSFDSQCLVCSPMTSRWILPQHFSSSRVSDSWHMSPLYWNSGSCLQAQVPIMLTCQRRPQRLLRCTAGINIEVACTTLSLCCSTSYDSHEDSILFAPSASCEFCYPKSTSTPLLHGQSMHHFFYHGILFSLLRSVVLSVLVVECPKLRVLGY